VRLSHSLARTRAVFDDPNLVSHGGLVPVMAPAERAGLPDLLAERARAAGQRARRRPGPGCGLARLRDGILLCLAGRVRPAAGRVDITHAQLESAWPLPGPVRRLVRAHRGRRGTCPAASWQLRPGHLRVRGQLCGATRPAVPYGVRATPDPAQFAALMHIACSDRHQPAPAATVSAHPAVSNDQPDAPLETCTRAHRTPTSARQSRSDLTERRGAPRARALAKLRYSPWPNYFSASAPFLRPPVPIPAMPIARSAPVRAPPRAEVSLVPSGHVRLVSVARRRSRR
jgi:hypothetical protein